MDVGAFIVMKNTDENMCLSQEGPLYLYTLFKVYGKLSDKPLITGHVFTVHFLNEK